MNWTCTGLQKVLKVHASLKMRKWCTVVTCRCYMCLMCYSHLTLLSFVQSVSAVKSKLIRPYGNAGRVAAEHQLELAIQSNSADAVEAAIMDLRKIDDEAKARSNGVWGAHCLRRNEIEHKLHKVCVCVNLSVRMCLSVCLSVCLCKYEHTQTHSRYTHRTHAHNTNTHVRAHTTTRTHVHTTRTHNVCV